MKILDEEIDLIKNIKQTLRSYPMWWIIFIISAGLDAASTLLFMQTEGIEREANSIIRLLALNFGMVLGVLLGKILQIISAVIFCALSIKLSRAILLLFLSLNLLAVYHNLSFNLM